MKSFQKYNAVTLFLLLTGCKAKITLRNSPKISVSYLLQENGANVGLFETLSLPGIFSLGCALCRHL
jgi:hypothetical protein